MSIDLSKLNKEQEEAVVYHEGPIAIIAGAGSGKTRVLSYRVAYLVEEMNFDPSSILAITFTNKAANEMKSRINSLIGEYNFKWIGTYHAICLKILKHDIQHLNRSPNFSVIDVEDQKSIIREIYQFRHFTQSEMKINKAVSLISLLKDTDFDFTINHDPFELRSYSIYTNSEYQMIKQIYLDYQKRLLDHNLVDFNDLIILTLELLDKFPDVANKWKHFFKYILVDEFQDTNLKQFKILLHLINPDKNNILIVGDPDQSIYNWRGSYSQIFLDFHKKFKNAKFVMLDINYRSTKSILNAANSLISHNKNRVDKKLQTQNPQGKKPIFYFARTQAEEAQYVCNKIKELNKLNVPNTEIAILYRSNFLSRYIEEQLISNSISYHIYGGFRFYERKEIKDLISYLKLMVSDDELSLKRVINVPNRKIGPQTIEKINQYCLEKDISFLEAIKSNTNNWNYRTVNSFYDLILKLREQTKGMTITEALKHIINELQYDAYLHSLDIEDRMENVLELLRTMENYEKENDPKDLNGYLEEISLYTESDEDQNKDKVSLMTVHRAKGTEFRYVFIIAFNDGVFPSMNAEDIQEERRIAYVGLTRAKEFLSISCNRGFGYLSHSSDESEFVDEIGKENLEIYNPKTKAISNLDLGWYNSKKHNFHDNYEQKNVTFNVGDVVVHTTFGSGTVVGIKGDLIDVLFKAPYGLRTIFKHHKNLKRIVN